MWKYIEVPAQDRNISGVKPLKKPFNPSVWCIYFPTTKKDFGPLSERFIGFIIMPIFSTSSGWSIELTISPAIPPRNAWLVSDYVWGTSTIYLAASVRPKFA